MAAKGEATRNRILDASKPLFANLGYTAVTMKDICGQCHLSRGGLYRHFGSTKEVFLAMLDRDMNEDQDAVRQAIQDGIPAPAILAQYALHEKREIFGDMRGLYFAIHEFAFSQPDQRTYIDRRANASIGLIRTLLLYGQKTGAFGRFDADAMATHLIFFFDALKTSASVLTLTEAMVDKQIDLVKEMLR